MQAIEFVVRDGAGNLSNGTFGNDGVGSRLNVGNGQQVSLHLAEADVKSYTRDGDDLVIELADGSMIRLAGYFDGENMLYLSKGGDLMAVELTQGADEELYALYQHEASWGKWSPSDDLIHYEEPEVMAAQFDTGLLGLGGIGGGAIPALVGVGGVITGVGGGDDGGGGGPTYDVTVEPGDWILGGDDDPEPSFPVIGTGVPGEDVVVTAGDVTQVVTVGDDGTWEVIFTGDTLPEDGDYVVEVTTNDQGGDEVVLTGPDVLIDTVAPEVTFTSGVVSTDDFFNGDSYGDGVVVSGTSEPGATLIVTVGGVATELVVGESGTWEVTFGPDAAPEGEYEADVSVYAVDAVGNSATYGDVIVVDTVGGVSFDDLSFGGDYTINGTEAEGSISFTGVTQPGSTVVISFEGTDYPATVAGDGSWSLTFGPGEFPGGEYEATLVATATDTHGNVTTASSSWTVDTVTNVTLTPGFAGADGVINAEDREGGLVLTGSTQPGNVVEVQIGDATYPATVSATGSWSLTLAPGDIPEGAYTSQISVTSTDGAGNVATTGAPLVVDTLGFVEFSGNPVTADDVVNGTEAGQSISLTGTTMPGSSVMITMNGANYPAVVDAGGNWVVTFPPSSFPAGEYDMPVTATATSPAGNASMATTVVDVDTMGWVTISGAPVTADDVVNAVEAADGVTLTGMTEPGSTVNVQLGNVTVPAVVAADGSWTASFAPGQIAPGTYQAPISVTATDAAGNSSTAHDTLAIDTETAVTLNTQVEGDGIINEAEAANGVVLTGTGEPGAAVQVTFAGVTRPATVDGAGNWQVAYLPGDIPAGETMASVSVTATDAAGNMATAAGEIEVDRIIDLTLDGPIAVDDIVNEVEHGEGVQLSGTVEPGSTVEVTLGNATHTAVVLADGTWFTTFAPQEVPEGDYLASISAVATDGAGNMASITDSVQVDTFVEPLTISTVEGDDIVNAEEQADGVSFAGTVEPGSSVIVSFEGTTHAATVDAAGNWTVAFAAGEIPTGEYTAAATVVATDAAGNTRTETTDVSVDTDNPDAPVILSFRQGGTGVREIGVDQNDDITEVQQIDGAGNVSAVAYDLEIDDEWGEVIFDFNEAIPTGSNLVVTSTDAAGNHAGTLFVMEDPGNSVVDLANPGLGQFDIQAVDLQFASEAELTITADQLAELSGFTNELVIHGGDDDIVNAAGATATGETRVIEGESYDVYTLGEGTLVVDQDIQVNPALV
ncbi:Ig-like domain-containing protein [Oceanicola sp. D3]|uniref:Ig-like domain-containing protein n=1 Tax=Oceanicola sp. D3 TaxID=2587163 RepID=UPI001AEFEC19|nr:Ig-like domain-containing protein [Oceanicola sp. D3]